MPPRNLAPTAEVGGPGWGMAMVFDATPGGGLSPGTRGLLDDRDGPLLGRPCPRIVVVRLARLVGNGKSGFRPADRDHTPEWLAGQIERCRAEALLVAGNRESKRRGSGDGWRGSSSRSSAGWRGEAHPGPGPSRGPRGNRPAAAPACGRSHA